MCHEERLNFSALYMHTPSMAEGGNLHLHVSSLPVCWPLHQMESTVHEDNLKKVVDIGVKGCGMVYTVLNSFVREHLEESQ